MPTDFTNDDYTVGWICALQAELAASQAMLGEEHPDLLQAENDTNTYTLGRIGQHNVVLACLPSGTTGISAAATAARDLLRSFPKVRFGLMVGVGGGAPSNPSEDPRKDIRLGDVVVSKPEGNCGGVLQYDFGKTVKDGKFIQTGSLNKPPTGAPSGSMLELNPAMQQDFNYRNPEDDQLFQPDFDHMDSEKDCKSCDKEHLVQRIPRTTNVPVIHYGLIGSGNRVMRHGVMRENLRRERGILCFEMEAAGLMDNFPCLVIRGICDYSDTHKNKHWQPYAAATAAAYAKELLEVIPPVQVDKTPTAADAEFTEKMNKIGEDVDHIRRVVNSTQEDEYRKKLLDWLSPIDYAELQSDTFHKRQKGTGEWFLKSTPFTEWLEGKEKTLFCPGIPGTGKTMIASIVVDHLETSFPDDKTGKAFLYCIYKRQDNQKVDDLLASLLGQLAVWQPMVPDSICKSYDKHRRGKKPRLSRDEILEALSSITKTYSRTFIVIDALDECKTDHIRNELLSEVYKLQEGSDTRLMVTFRPSIVPKCPSSVAELKIRAHKEDVEEYLSGRMSELPTVIQNDNELQYKIKTRILSLVDGMFLLAQLYINSLTDKFTERKINTALGNMKKGEEALDKAYDDTVNRIENQGHEIHELAKKVLFWVVYAKRPLTAEELRHGLAVEPGTCRLDKANLCPVKDMVSSCAGLITVDSNIVRLVHYTTQEYFQRRGLKSFEDVQRDIIATSCLTYLLYDVFAECCFTESDLASRLQQNAYFEYAAQNWVYHMQDTQQSVGDLALKLLMDDGKVSASNQVLFGYNFPQQFYGVHLTAYFGLNDIMVRLLEEKYPDAKDSSGWTPLSYAVERGNARSVELFLDYNVDLNSKCRAGWTPFSLSIERGSAAVVQLLLAKGAKIDNRYELEVVELLLKNRSQPDLEDEDSCTPLSRAIEGGNAEVVELLLALGVKVDYQYRLTPLSRAAEKGDKEVVELLLKNRARPDLEDEINCTPLSRAIEGGNAEVVELLLALGVKVDYRYPFTPLSRAAEKGDKGVVELLLKNRVQPDLEDEDSCTPLSRAIEGENAEVVELLLALGVKVDYRYRLTPLSRAAEYGNKAVVELLLKYGAQPDLEDARGCTPLSRAVSADVVQLLKIARSSVRALF
ncbi:hypothetical protein V8E54_001050 [Elaphomyces granulatus]